MTHIDDILNPASIAIVGASDNPTRIGGRPLAMLLSGGFEGEIYPVNPTRSTVQGVKAWPSLADLPKPPDFVLVAVPAPMVNGVLRQAVLGKARTALVFSSGFAEDGDEGAARQAEMAKIAAEGGLRLLGPNCIGCFNLHNKFYPSFSATLDLAPVLPGATSIISQSGAIGTHLYGMAAKRGIKIGRLITTGNEADIHVGEVVHMLARDDKTEVILAYAEAIRDGAMLIEALDLARANRKPVIVVKSGRSAIGAQAIASHTASLAGEDETFDAVLAHHGAWRADSLEEMVDLAAAARPKIYPAGKRLGIITISGGAGIMMTDCAETYGLDVAEMPKAAQSQIKSAMPFASPRNPIDVSAQIMNDLSTLPEAVATMLDAGRYDVLAGFWATAPSNPTIGTKLRDTLTSALASRPPVLFPQVFMTDQDARNDYECAGFPTYYDTNHAVRAIAAMCHFGNAFSRPPVPKPLPISVRIPHRSAIGERDAKEILAAAGLPVSLDVLINTPADATAAVRANAPAAMKIASPDILHKSDIGGVALSILENEAAGTFERIMKSAALHAPDAQLDGVLVSPMARDGVDLILGGRNDPIFGPMILVGLGGIFAEVLKDTVLRPAPVDPATAHDMINSLRGCDLLRGARGSQPVDLDSLADSISLFSRIFAGLCDQFSSVEINPLRAFPDGCIALDAAFVRHDGITRQ